MIESGIINVYKEKGYTSNDVVAILRKLAGTKAGHTGTLDPNAEGVLPICLGRATKLADFIMAEDKVYVAEVVLGVVTDTGDITGRVLTRGNGEAVSENDFARVAAGFEGEQWQVPPMYSAIKIGGKKLYELARKGETVERKPRRVFIERVRVLGGAAGRFLMEVSCSKGTYIRTLCEDIGAALGCGATMGDLTRTKNGLFALENAVKINDLRTVAAAEQLHEYVMPVDAVLPYPKAAVSAEGLKMAMNGNPLPPDLVRGVGDNEKCWLYAPDGKMIGLFSLAPGGNRLRAEVML